MITIVEIAILCIPPEPQVVSVLQPDSSLLICGVGDELEKTMNEFEELLELPCAAGAIDGCFIPMWTPGSLDFAHRCWCYKNIKCIILLAVVDANKRFTYINVGRPGSVGDAATINDSELKSSIMSGEYLNVKHSRWIDCEDGSNVRIRPYLVADSAFPFSPFTMKNWDRAGADADLAEEYNVKHKGTRVVVEQSFGILLDRKLRNPFFLAEVTRCCCYCTTFAASCRIPTITSSFPDQSMLPNWLSGMHSKIAPPSVVSWVMRMK